jgi:hypothetical protein
VEEVLLRLARQLMAYDEASLISLWEKYAEAVKRFEPTKRWEESVVVLSMIQAMRFKNQLFNLHWSEGRTPSEVHSHPHIEAVPQPPGKRPGKAKGKVLAFKTKDEDQATPEE